MAGHTIIFVHRDAWQKDTELNNSLVAGFSGEGIDIILESYDTRGDIRTNFIENLPWFRRVFYWLPIPIKKLAIYIIQLLYGIAHPSYLPYVCFPEKYQKIDLPIKKRCADLRKVISELETDNPTIIIARSAGCIMATTIADEFNIAHIICLGYPFKNPENKDQPYRYVHLKNLKTPTLIIQGYDDEYGGKEIIENYELSSNIELFFIDADHDLNLNKYDMNSLIEKIKIFTKIKYD